MDNNENIKVKSIYVVVDGQLIKHYIVTDSEKVLLEKSVFALEHSVKSVHREILQSIKDEDELKKRLEKSLVGVVHWWIKINDDLTLNVTEEPNGLYHVSLSGKFIGNIEGSYTLIDKLIFVEFKKKKDDKTYLSTFLLNKIYGLKNVDPLRISIENIIKAKKINKSTFM